MTRGATLKECASELRILAESFKSVQGKPRNLTLVNSYLYWTQGVDQELYRVAIDTSVAGKSSPGIRGEVQRVITAATTSHADDPSVPNAASAHCAPSAEAGTSNGATHTTTGSAVGESTPALSREEELLRERTRSQLTGITSFCVRRSDNAIFFVRAVDLFVYYQNGPRAHQPPLRAMDYLSEADAAHFVAQGSRPHMFIQHISTPPQPAECRELTLSATQEADDATSERDEAGQGKCEEESVSLTTFTFVNNNNIYLAHIEEQTSHSGPPLKVTLTQVTHVGDEQHPCGVADYITQEEFEQLSGHVATSRYILFTVIDETKLRRVRLLKGTTGPAKRAVVWSDTETGRCKEEAAQHNSNNNDTETRDRESANEAKPHDEETDSVEEMRYARVGDANSSAVLAVYERASGRIRVIPPTWIAATTANATNANGWSSSSTMSTPEYIPRFGFKNSETVYLSVLNRAQTDYAVLSFAIADLPIVANEMAVREVLEQGHQFVTTPHEITPGVVEWQQSIPWAWVDVMPGPPIHFGSTMDVLICNNIHTPFAHTHLFTRSRSLLVSSDATAAATKTSHAVEGAADVWRALTQGEWNVRPNSVQICRNCVYFIANAEGYLNHCLYAIPLSSNDSKIGGTTASRNNTTEVDENTSKNTAATAGGLPQRLSPVDEHVYHYIVVDGVVAYVASTLDHPAELYLTTHNDKGSYSNSKHRNDEHTSPVLVQQTRSTAARTRVAVAPYTTLASSPTTAPQIPLVFTIPNRHGVPLGVHLYPAARAHHFDATNIEHDGNRGHSKDTSHGTLMRKTPLVLYVYGGPHAQLVNASEYDGICRAPVQLLVRRGLTVAVVDNRMSNANGLRVRSVCKRNMGGFETDDYVDAVQYLCNANTDIIPGWPTHLAIDSHRVGIFGWSYGGYATLLALSQAPGVFKMGFAGAPVGDWRLYDTGYTERYMGLLYEPTELPSKPNQSDNRSDNGEIDGNGDATLAPQRTSALPNRAYDNSCIAHFAHGFPDEPNRLFIAHGTLDENVHFAHTCHVINALVQECKPYSALIYPGERHGLRQNVKSRDHHDALLVLTMSTYL